MIKFSLASEKLQFVFHFKQFLRQNFSFQKSRLCDTHTTSFQNLEKTDDVVDPSVFSLMPNPSFFRGVASTKTGIRHKCFSESFRDVFRIVFPRFFLALLFLQKAPPYMFDRVLNTLLNFVIFSEQLLHASGQLLPQI